jgi:hypothetical protein
MRKIMNGEINMFALNWKTSLRRSLPGWESIEFKVCIMNEKSSKGWHGFDGFERCKCSF